MKFYYLAIPLIPVLIYFGGRSIGHNKAKITSPADFSSSHEETADIGITGLEDEYVSPISIKYLRSQTFEGSDIIIEEELSPGSNYKRYIASYISDGNKIYGLLTVPNETMPQNGYRAVVFNHGYIPPHQYVTTEKYVHYIDALARNGLVVFKIDLRGHGRSEGRPTGSYFSSAYTVDAINAVKSLQKFEHVNPERIGMWGHSMSGNLLLRAMLVSEDIKAGVIWAGAVYSYEDFAKYRISDSSYVPRPSQPQEQPDPQEDNLRENSQAIRDLRQEPEKIDFNDNFWSSISMTKNLSYLKHPVQLHHAVNDNVVNIGYSRDLAKALNEAGKTYEIYEYPGGGHNIEPPSFDTAIQRTVDFYLKYL